ncbi:hypothetical protein H8959_002618 [Pygathrix nigripes]
MNSRILQVFQRELTCPICMNYFIDPVTIDCGHSFCRPCFYLNWQDFPILTQCFECIKATQHRNLKTDIHLKKMASLARKASLWLFLSSEEQMCGTHRETKKMFCEVDKSLLCLLCSSSQEHRDHRHCPIEWAAEEHREKLLKKMQFLWEKACENHRNLNVETTRTRHWKAFGDILHRSESVLLHMPQPLNLELSAGPITGLRDRLNQFRVDITLHHDEANSHIFQYGDLRSICIGLNIPHSQQKYCLRGNVMIFTNPDPKMTCCSFFFINMNSGILQVFQRVLTCPICMNYFIDPVTIDCGQHLLQALFLPTSTGKTFPILAQCFECIKTTQNRNLKTNIRVKKNGFPCQKSQSLAIPEL